MLLRTLSILLSAWMVLGTAALTSAQVMHDTHGDAGVACETCHQQPPPAPVANTTCVACHGTMIETPPSGLSSIPDPHRSPHLAEGEVPICSECHSIHGQSQVTCTMCHRGFQFDIK